MNDEPNFGKIATRIIFENETVRVWDLTLEPNEATDWHQHEVDYMFVVLENGHVQTEYIDGTVEKQFDPVGHCDFRKKDMAHRLVNNDNKTYKNLVIEFLRNE